MTEVPKELKHINASVSTDPKNSEEMSHAENKAALQYLIFMKQKGGVKIKGRSCSVIIKQSQYLTK